MHRLNRTLVLAFLSCGVSPCLFGADAPTAAAPLSAPAYEYPELVVAPSASDRLKMEAGDEAKETSRAYLPMRISAASTLLAGLVALGDPGRSSKKDSAEEDSSNSTNKEAMRWASYSGIAVGGGWLGASFIMAKTYRPYRDGYKEIGKSSGNRRDQLTRERLAEEKLIAPAALQRRLKWISAVTNLGAAAYIGSTSGNDLTKLSAAFAGVMAFTPILFPSHWETVANYHEQYKKRVYGPLTEVQFQPQIGSLAARGTASLSWIF